MASCSFTTGTMMENMSDSWSVGFSGAMGIGTSMAVASRAKCHQKSVRKQWNLGRF
jgi:hypothetical protein